MMSKNIDKGSWKKFKKVATTLETIKINELRKENAYNCLVGITFSSMFALTIQLLYSDQTIIPNNLLTKIVLATLAGAAVTISSTYGYLVANNCKKIKKCKLERNEKYQQLLQEYQILYDVNNMKIK